MQQGTDNALRTRVYIDGYNLYYGCLKHSTDKWLDVRTLIRQHTRAIVGLIAPARQQTGNVNAELQKHAHWTRTHILDEEFAQSHLPPMIRLKNKSYINRCHGIRAPIS